MCQQTIQLRLPVKDCAMFKLNWCLRNKINSSLAIARRLWLRSYCGVETSVVGRPSLIVATVKWIHFWVLSMREYVVFCEFQNKLIEIKAIAKTKTRMHSSRMRTLRCSGDLPRVGCLPREGVSSEGVVCAGGGVSAQEGGVSAWGVSARGVSAPVHAGIHTPQWTEWQTPVKT